MPTVETQRSYSRKRRNNKHADRVTRDPKRLKKNKDFKALARHLLILNQDRNHSHVRNIKEILLLCARSNECAQWLIARREFAFFLQCMHTSKHKFRLQEIEQLQGILNQGNSVENVFFPTKILYQLSLPSFTVEEKYIQLMVSHSLKCLVDQNTPNEIFISDLARTLLACEKSRCIYELIKAEEKTLICIIDKLITLYKDQGILHNHYHHFVSIFSRLSELSFFRSARIRQFLIEMCSLIKTHDIAPKCLKKIKSAFLPSISRYIAIIEFHYFRDEKQHAALHHALLRLAKIILSRNDIQPNELINIMISLHAIRRDFKISGWREMMFDVINKSYAYLCTNITEHRFASIFCDLIAKLRPLISESDSVKHFAHNLYNGYLRSLYEFMKSKTDNRSQEYRCVFESLLKIAWARRLYYAPSSDQFDKKISHFIFENRTLVSSENKIYIKYVQMTCVDHKTSAEKRIISTSSKSEMKVTDKLVDVCKNIVLLRHDLKLTRNRKHVSTEIDAVIEVINRKTKECVIKIAFMFDGVAHFFASSFSSPEHRYKKMIPETIMRDMLLAQYGFEIMRVSFNEFDELEPGLLFDTIALKLSKILNEHHLSHTLIGQKAISGHHMKYRF